MQDLTSFPTAKFHSKHNKYFQNAVDIHWTVPSAITCLKILINHSFFCSFQHSSNISFSLFGTDFQGDSFFIGEVSRNHFYSTVFVFNSAFVTVVSNDNQVQHNCLPILLVKKTTHDKVALCIKQLSDISNMKTMTKGGLKELKTA